MPLIVMFHRYPRTTASVLSKRIATRVASSLPKVGTITSYRASSTISPTFRKIGAAAVEQAVIVSLDEDPDPKQAADQARTSTHEDKANEDPSTSKPVATLPSAGQASQALDPDDVAAIEELEEQELIATPPHSKEFLARLDAAKKRREEREAKKLARKRERNAAANRRHRARKKAAQHDARAPSLPTLGAKWATRRLHALIKATSDHRADKRLVKLRGREEEIVWFVQLQRHLGESATRAEIAQLMGNGKSPESVKNLTELVRKLEHPGGPWHDME